MAKSIAHTFNGSRVAQRKGDRHYDVIWIMKYLSKFKWSNLVQKFAHDSQLRKTHLDFQAQADRKKVEFFKE